MRLLKSNNYVIRNICHCLHSFFPLQMYWGSAHFNEKFCTHRVVHMTVCLSDSQLHLFLQTQLPVSHIQDCVNGHTPYSVTDAILTYASSNRGWAQEEGGGPLETCPTPISYESIERYRWTLSQQNNCKIWTNEWYPDWPLPIFFFL